MPKVTEEHLRARRQQILDAAAECFAESGFHQATMHDICQLAELSPGAVYRYFGSKEDIIEAMVDESRTKTLMAMATLIEGSKDFTGALDRLTEKFVARAEDIQGCALDIQLLSEAMSSPRVRHAFAKSHREARKMVQLVVAAAQDRGEINPALDSDSVAQVLVAMFDGLVAQKSLERNLDVWNYARAVRAILTGNFWVGESADVGA